MTLNRRSALTLLGGGGAAMAAGAAPAREARAAAFRHGVASGDPAADGAVLWTRATVDAADAEADVPLGWEVAETPGGAPVRRGRVVARAAADHTAKAVVDGLRPGREYHYRFVGPDGAASPAGRFRTLPVGRTDWLVLAVASCQLYPGGYFNAYADMAGLAELDVVLHLGDYIYEYGADGYGADVGRALGRLPDPPHETVTLADYRRRHAQVKADPDMQAAHARAAFICVWDDHETANDSWIGGAENHDPATEGTWAARKAAALRAYFEWMPIRDPAPGTSWEAINRGFEFGDLATLAMVETRLLARDRQVAAKGAAPAPDEYAAMLAERARPDRELLGAAQQKWLEGVLAASVRAGKPWQLLGNQVVMARVAGPDLERAMGAKAYAARMAAMPAQWRDRLAGAMRSYRAGLPFNFDSWDGYPAARERLYAAFARAGSHPLVLAGDSHAAWANDLYDEGGRLAATEFGCTAITSPSYGSLLPGLGAVLADQNREVVFCDQDAKGYTLLTLTPGEARADFVAVATVRERSAARRPTNGFRVAAGPTRAPLTRA